MTPRNSKFKLCLLGPFNLENPDGHRISIPSRKGAALIAMLAVSKNGERARSWLQTQLWSSRGSKEANGSLRRELSELRKLLNDPAYTLLICERDRVRLDLSIVSVDVFETDEEVCKSPFGQPGQFLEGLDVPDEEIFEDWLREQRNRLAELAANRAHSGRTAPQLPFSDGLSSRGLTRELPRGSDGPSLPVPGLVVGSAPPLSIVVMPFTNIGSDPDQEHFVEGVTEGLTTDMSRIVGLFVIGRNTAFTYEGKAFDLKQVSRELNVRYVLQGSVQKRGDRLRVNVQLADAEIGVQVWAERFDKDITDLFEVQDEIVSRLANQLEAQLTEEVARRSEQALHPSSMELYFHGRALLNKGWTPECLAQAKGSFERALAHNPKNIDAMIGTAIVELILSGSLLSDNQATHRTKAEVTLTQVLSLAPNHAFAHLALGATLIETNRVAQGIAECERALALDRNLAEAHAQIGLAKILMGRPAETGAHINEALRLSPRDPFVYRWLMWAGIANLVLGQDADALGLFRRSLEFNRNHPLGHFFLAAALALLGSLNQAAAAAKAGLAIDPSFTLRRYRDAAQCDNPTYLAGRERVYAGLRMAGLPEG